MPDVPVLFMNVGNKYWRSHGRKTWYEMERVCECPSAPVRARMLWVHLFVCDRLPFVHRSEGASVWVVSVAQLSCGVCHVGIVGARFVRADVQHRQGYSVDDRHFPLDPFVHVLSATHPNSHLGRVA